MLSDAELDMVVDFVTGSLGDGQLRELLLEADGNPELLAALTGVAPLRDALANPELRRELLDDPEATSSAAVESVDEEDLDTTVDRDFEELRQLIRQICPTEWNMAGPAAVDEILHGHTEFADAPGASFLDTTASLRVLVAMARLLGALLQLRGRLAHLQREGSNDAAIAAVRQEAVAALDSEATATLRPDKRKRAIDAVFPPSAR
jgi:hypothetical protein